MSGATAPGGGQGSGTPGRARLGGTFRRYGQSHGVLIPDVLIAATAQIQGARLVTPNARDFPMLDDLLVPYP